MTVPRGHIMAKQAIKAVLGQDSLALSPYAGTLRDQPFRLLDFRHRSLAAAERPPTLSVALGRASGREPEGSDNNITERLLSRADDGRELFAARRIFTTLHCRTKPCATCTAHTPRDTPQLNPRLTNRTS